jgi:hypothetical protein
MSSLLYQLSYNLEAKKGFTPISIGHEPTMFLITPFRIDKSQYKIIIYFIRFSLV